MEYEISADSLREYAENTLDEGPALEAIRECSDDEIKALIKQNIDEGDFDAIIAEAESVVIGLFVQEHED